MHCSQGKHKSSITDQFKQQTEFQFILSCTTKFRFLSFGTKPWRTLIRFTRSIVIIVFQKSLHFQWVDDSESSTWKCGSYILICYWSAWLHQWESENKIKQEAWSFSSRARWQTNTGGTHELSGSHDCVASFVLVLFLHFEFILQTQNIVFWYFSLIKEFGNFWQVYLPYRATKLKLLLARDDFCLPWASRQALSYNIALHILWYATGTM